MGEELEYFSKEDKQMADKHMKYDQIIDCQENVKSKPVIPPHSHQDGYYQEKRKKITNVSKDGEKLKYLCPAGRDVE